MSLATRSRQIINQNIDKKDPQPKIDMGEKLQAWREAKGKVFPSVSTMGKGKPLFHTPSHHHINQLRRLERGIPKDSPKARSVEKNLIPLTSINQLKMRGICLLMVYDKSLLITNCSIIW